jgi:haloalkane dehalogenase
VAGIAFAESIVKPLSSGDLSPQARKRTETIRDPKAGEELGLATDGLVRQAFTGGVRTPVSVLVERIEAFDEWLASSRQVPKLLMTFEGSPTLMITKELAAWCTANIAALETVACGEAGHHAPRISRKRSPLPSLPGLTTTACASWRRFPSG